MPFVPRNSDDITLSMAARMVARTKLTDIAVGSDLRFTLQTVGEEIAVVEQRLKGVRDSFYILNPAISLADFDERLLELPTPQTRQKATNAAGAVMTITRTASAAEQTLPIGSTFSRVDGVTYKTTAAYVFGVNVGAITGVAVVCVVAGTAGNCVAGSISNPVNAPSWVVSASNAIALTNGIDFETKQQAQVRMALYLQSLARSQPSALLYAALSFVSTGSSKLKFAKHFVDPLWPGRTTIVVDDGTGMAGLTQAGTTIIATVPTNGVRALWHDSPATKPISSVQVTTGAVVTYLQEGIDYDSLYERGIIRLRPQTVLAAGAIWQTASYSVYTGIIRELQKELDGDPSDPQNKPGWVAAGCRVFVQPPTIYVVAFDVHVVPMDNYDIATLVATVLAVAAAYTQTLGPGEPLFIAALTKVLMTITGLRNVHIFNSGTNTQKEDVYPGELEVIRGGLGTITAFPTLPT